MGMIGIKLLECNYDVGCAKILRKYNDNSLVVNKSLVENNDYLLTCDYIDAEGIKRILNLYQDFKERNKECIIYENGCVSSVEFLKNLLISYDETEKQVERDIDDELIFKDI